jgi:hypothetical protein
MPKISQLPAGTAPTGIEILPAVQGGVTSSFSFNQLAALSATLGTYTPPGAGAVPTTIAAKLAPYRSIFDFMTAAQIADVQARTSLVPIEAAVSSATAAFPNGGTLYCPTGLYDLTTITSILTSNFTLLGDGQGATVFRAKAAANSSGVIQSLVANVTLERITFDGNRANGGLNPTPSFESCVRLSGSNNKIINCEVRFGTGYGMYTGAAAGTPTQLVVDGCWIHDNGGVISSTGYGIGIEGTAPAPTTDITIVNNRFENNYNTVTGPGTSAAINIAGTRIVVANNYFLNNYNVNGGQCVLYSDQVLGATDGLMVVCNNVIEQTGNFGGDLTCGFEIEANKVVCCNNVVKEALGVDAIRFEVSAGDSVISNNVLVAGLNTGNSGINLIKTIGVGVGRTRINDNHILSGNIGINVQANPGNVIVIDNYIDSSITKPIVGNTNIAIIRNNQCGAIAGVTGTTTTAGASPFTFPVLNYDATYQLGNPQGITSWGLDSASGPFLAPIGVNTQIFCKAGHSVTLWWLTTASVINIQPQQ